MDRLLSTNKDAETIAAIVAIETGWVIKIGDLPEECCRKLAKTIMKMHLELQEIRKRPDLYADFFSENDADRSSGEKE